MNRSALWRGSECGREFANIKQSHSCGRYDIERHLESAPPHLRAVFETLLAMVRSIGPVTLAPAKTRIGFQVRMIFAAVQFRTTCTRTSFWRGGSSTRASRRSSASPSATRCITSNCARPRMWTTMSGHGCGRRTP